MSPGVEKALAFLVLAAVGRLLKPRFSQPQLAGVQRLIMDATLPCTIFKALCAVSYLVDHGYRVIFDRDDATGIDTSHILNKATGKTIKMIDELAVQEQEEDDANQQYCKEKFDELENNQNILEQAVSDLETATEDAKESTSNFKFQHLVMASELWMRRLPRQKEHGDFTDTLAADAAAVDLLKFAKNRLNNAGSKARRGAEVYVLKEASNNPE